MPSLFDLVWKPTWLCFWVLSRAGAASDDLSLWCLGTTLFSDVQEAVQKPFDAGRVAGRERLMHLLRALMIRSAKADLRTIPPCRRQVVRRDSRHLSIHRAQKCTPDLPEVL